MTNKLDEDYEDLEAEERAYDAYMWSRLSGLYAPDDPKLERYAQLQYNRVIVRHRLNKLNAELSLKRILADVETLDKHFKPGDFVWFGPRFQYMYQEDKSWELPEGESIHFLTIPISGVVTKFNPEDNEYGLNDWVYIKDEEATIKEGHLITKSETFYNVFRTYEEACASDYWKKYTRYYRYDYEKRT